MPSPVPHPDDVADCVLGRFNALPAKFKPRTLADGRREWVTLAGIVLSKTGQTRSHHKDHNSSADEDSSSAKPDGQDLLCASLATGVKCLPADKVHRAQGNVLHDCHAEILAIRAFNRWLVDECADLARKGLRGQHAWLRWCEKGRGPRPDGADSNPRQETSAEAQDDPTLTDDDVHPPFELVPDVAIHMYVSEAPCGDASMELVMASQADPTPWSTNPTTPPLPPLDPSALLGRGHFDRLGIVRRKPARPDAPVTLSKSCSDKLALKQCTSLLSALTARLVRPRSAYLAGLVLPAAQLVPAACERAFAPTGRLAPVARDPALRARWRRSGFEFRAFNVRASAREFAFSRAATASTTPSNLAAVVTPSRAELLIGGVVQGRRQFDPRGASCVSRRSLWAAAREVALLAGRPGLATEWDGRRRYADVKAGDARADVKKDAIALALKGWQEGAGDEAWMLERPGEEGGG